MATRATIVSTSAGSTEGRLGRILEHFGVRTEVLGVDAISAWPSGAGRGQEAFALFASLEAFAAVMRAAEAVRLIEAATAVYLYTTTDRIASETALRQLEGWASASLESLGTGPCSLVVSNDLAELDGPMAASRFRLVPYRRTSFCGIPAPERPSPRYSQPTGRPRLCGSSGTACRCFSARARRWWISISLSAERSSTSKNISVRSYRSPCFSPGRVETACGGRSTPVRASSSTIRC